MTFGIVEDYKRVYKLYIVFVLKYRNMVTRLYTPCKWKPALTIPDLLVNWWRITLIISQNVLSVSTVF